MVDLTGDDLNYFSAFEKITRVMPNDYFSGERFIVFLVNPKEVSKALGKNFQLLGNVFRKKVLVIADYNTPEEFVRSFFGNLDLRKVEMQKSGEKEFLVAFINEKDRGLAIGRDGERIKTAKTLMQKKFNLDIQIKSIS